MTRFNPRNYNPIEDSSAGQYTAGVLVLVQHDNSCPCGCGIELASGSRFRMGHDARYKGKLMRAHTTDTPVHIVDEKRRIRVTTALKLAEAQGWADLIDNARGVYLRRAESHNERQQSRARRNIRNVGDLVLVKIGRWEYTGVITCLFEDGSIEIEYTKRDGSTHTHVVDADKVPGLGVA